MNKISFDAFFFVLFIARESPTVICGLQMKCIQIITCSCASFFINSFHKRVPVYCNLFKGVSFPEKILLSQIVAYLITVLNKNSLRPMRASVLFLNNYCNENGFISSTVYENRGRVNRSKTFGDKIFANFSGFILRDITFFPVNPERSIGGVSFRIVEISNCMHTACILSTEK